MMISAFLLSRVGINRKSKEPFKTQNAPYQKKRNRADWSNRVTRGNTAIGEPAMGTLDGVRTKRTDGKRNIRDRKRDHREIRRVERQRAFTPRGFVRPARR